MKSSDICAALRDRYKQPEWALFFEVANGTGANARRHADALAMNMYPSRGLAILGFEIKVSRGDLKRELDNPDKAEEIARFCNEWWLVVPKGLIRDDDSIPAPWGVMECEGNSLHITKKALPLEAKPVTKEFMAAVLRSAGKVDEETLRQERGKAYAEYRKNYDEHLKQEIESRSRRWTETQNKLDELEKATGKKISQYANIPKLAEHLRMVEHLEELYGRWGTLTSVRRHMESFLKETEGLVKEEPQNRIAG